MGRELLIKGCFPCKHKNLNLMPLLYIKKQPTTTNDKLGLVPLLPAHLTYISSRALRASVLNKEVKKLRPVR